LVALKRASGLHSTRDVDGFYPRKRSTRFRQHLGTRGRNMRLSILSNCTTKGHYTEKTLRYSSLAGLRPRWPARWIISLICWTSLVSGNSHSKRTSPPVQARYNIRSILRRVDFTRRGQLPACRMAWRTSSAEGFHRPPALFSVPERRRTFGVLKTTKHCLNWNDKTWHVRALQHVWAATSHGRMWSDD
jgi:hypothetical protein